MKNLIDSLGITHRRFAEKFNIPYNTVAQWYKGERSAPKWVKSLIEQIIELKKRGTQIEIDKRYLLCANNTPMKWIQKEEDKTTSYSTRHGKCTNSIWECTKIEEITPD